ncbi:glucuronate isomerase [Labilibaculum sp. A4]|uniref:glucuronate isomerase n=1 Tax=Labilibaculum TaxID=2060722 RepID=UPI000F620016|nr:MULTISPECIES: glucuronate isomerase [Labilibaculum]MBN2597849.1 glucuronate isomerase [Marinifilaceae bacterium]MDQ1771234.1 glucuronate isomerase [Labilibaculum euxinus]MWN77021.1 glucuronate isomerase [Labilibaculum euxinus]
MKKFLDKDFILETDTAKKLYHEFAADLPIIDYHCHISPKEIADDKQFENMTQIWLYGDHYKWRAMRTNGIKEEGITGESSSDREKFENWACTVPYTLRNPLYHWTHLELKKPFGIEKILSPDTSEEIWNECNEKLNTPEFSCRSLIRKANVEVIGTTDDPADSLEYHKAIKDSGFETKVVPSWRPDKAMAVDDASEYNAYINKLAIASEMEINTFEDLLSALQKRHDFFAEMGCKASDHGLEQFFAAEYTNDEATEIFVKIRKGEELNEKEILKFKSAMLYEFAVLDHSKGWVQQFHIGAIRNNNTGMFNKLGADTGFDSIADKLVAEDMSKFLNRLATEEKLTKTILYNLNPAHNEVYATMLGNFQDGEIAGKIQWGSGWWFLDQKDGMEKQMNALSNLGLLSRFVGMLTDSRSFLSYSRHEYFRRILCNLIGNDVEKGLIPYNEELLKEVVQGICYYNAKNYFNF